MKKGQKKQEMNNRLTANNGVCSFEGCSNLRYSIYHGYCVEHRRLIARQSEYKRYWKMRAK